MCHRSTQSSGRKDRIACRLKAREASQRCEREQNSMHSPKHTKCMSVACNGSGQHYSECSIKTRISKLNEKSPFFVFYCSSVNP
jgi:hypothetical protein